jgi:hypothetical protein
MIGVSMRPLLAGLLLVAGIWCTAVQSEEILDPDNLPPAEPGAEKVVAEDAEFIAQCKSHIGYDMSRWIIVKTVLTKSDNWGLVWRVDYSETTAKADSISTLVCWKTPSGVWAKLRYLDRPR